MDRFITHEGQMPIWLGDIDYMTGVFRDTVADIMKGMAGRESFILNGFWVDWTMQGDRHTYWWTAGLIVINGEILHIDAGTLTIEYDHEPLGPLGLKVEVSYDNTGDRPLKSGELVKCYQTRKATVVAEGGTVKLTTLKRFEKIFADMVAQTLPPFSERMISEGTSYNVANGNSGDCSTIRIYNIVGAYYLAFSVNMTSPSGELPILYEGKLYTNGGSALAASIVSRAQAGSQIFNLPLKKELNDTTSIINVPCEATINSQGATVNVRIKPSEALPSAVYNGNCFIRIGI